MKKTNSNALNRYHSLIDESVLDDIYALAGGLQGARIAHVNATATGGGVAEILTSILPLYRELGIDATWLVLEGDDSFFAVTKQLHNSLQGGNCPLSSSDWKTHQIWNRHNANQLKSQYDIVFVHDPQPALMQEFARDRASHWIWRCHIDTSNPDLETWQHLCNIIQHFDAMVFSMDEFIGPGLSGKNIRIIQPAIDPFTPKNELLPKEQAAKIISGFGVDHHKPLISQISRFDPWKDPLGVLASFSLLKEHHPHLQLALLGNFADDDPEGVVIYEEVVKAAACLSDVHIITGQTDLVGPFQSESQVILQKSTREGFGLTATEAMWKGTPVVAGNVGGLRLQISDGLTGYLVSSVEECAERVDYLLKNDEKRLAMGRAAREKVRGRFLLPRLLKDELLLASNLLND